MTRALWLLMVSSAASAGTTLTWERTRGDEAPSTLVMKCEGGNARFEGVAGGGRVVIWDSATKTLNVLRTAEKTYTQLTEAQLDAMKERAKVATEQMKGRMEKLNPQQRAQFEQMMSLGAPTGEWKFTPTGKKARVGKWDCEWHDGERGTVKAQSCMVPWSAAPAKKEDLECVKSAANMLRSLSAGMGDGSPDDITKFPGIPVQTTRELGDGKKAVNTLKSVERGAMPADTFAVPKDYTLTHTKEGL